MPPPLLNKSRPPSATPTGLVAAGVVFFALGAYAAFVQRIFGYNPISGSAAFTVAWLILVVGGGMVLVDVVFYKSYKNADADCHVGLRPPRNDGVAERLPRGSAARNDKKSPSLRGPSGAAAISPPTTPQYNLSRTLKKYLALHLTLATIALCYWTLREYQGDFFHPFFRIAQILFPFFSVLSLPYIAWVDARMRNPHDAYYLIGHQFTTGLTTLITKRQWSLTYAQVHEHILGWIVKGFFTPLMFGFAVNNAHTLFRFEPQNLNFQAIFAVTLTALYFIDCIWAAAGYVFALRLTDSHIRSSQPTWQGWVAALICYEPFSRGVWPSYMAYESQQTWLQWLGPDGAAAQALRHSVLPPEAAATLAQTLYVTWGAAILVLIAVYTWATMSFGLRFSNLTHRGIITSGPYRFLKHPAYLCKNLSWWLISMPFMLSSTWQDSLRHCAMLLLANAVYYWRAKTEEKHLLSDHNYQAYAQSFHTKTATL